MASASNRLNRGRSEPKVFLGGDTVQMIAYSHIRPHYATWSNIIRASPFSKSKRHPALVLIEWITGWFSGAFDFFPPRQGKGTLVGCRQTNLAHGITPFRPELVKQGDNYGPTEETLSPQYVHAAGRRSGPPKARGVHGHP